MRRLYLLAALVLALAAPARADIVVEVDNPSQRMQVYVDGALAYVWKVSTARTAACACIQPTRAPSTVSCSNTAALASS